MKNSISKPQIFVFESNLAGIHGKGDSLHAYRYYGAIKGQAVGLQGQSYGIPTKDKKINILPLNEIKKYIDEFIIFAKSHKEYIFNVSKIGIGYAGYTPITIAPLFTDAVGMENVKLPVEFTSWFEAVKAFSAKKGMK